MKVCIYGAGAIGGYLAVELAQVAGVEVSAIARGGHLAAIREKGLKLVIGEETRVGEIAASDDAVHELLELARGCARQAHPSPRGRELKMEKKPRLRSSTGST